MADNVVPYIGIDSILKGELLVEKKSDKLVNTFMLRTNPKFSNKKSLILHAVDPINQKEELITLYDNGKFGDKMANDGIYSGISYLPLDHKQKFFLRESYNSMSHTVLFETILLRF
jgi:hypothetical protein